MGSAQERTGDARGDLAADVRRAAETYMSALHRGDVSQLVALWTADGDFVDSLGRVTKGRDLARQVVARQRKDDAAPLAATVDSIRMVTPDVAIEDGTTEAPAGNDNPLAIAHYTAIWVKHDGRWLLDSVRESASREYSHHDRLRPLSWLVGDWVQDRGPGRVELTCRWSPDGNYLLREMKIETPEGQSLNVSQRIGWDASKKQITAWTFDSEGGYGVGAWSPQGNQWVVRSTGVLPDGQSAASTSTYTRQGDGAFTWESTPFTATGTPAAQHKMELVRRPSSAKPNRLLQP